MLRKLSDFLVFSNFFIALAVACLALETQLLIYDSLSFRFPLFVFCATLFLYSFHRAYRMHKRSEEEQREKRHVWVKENKLLFYSVFFLAGAFLAWFTLTHLHLRVILYLVPVAVIAFGYSVPFIPVRGQLIRLRDIHMLKIFLIVFVIAWVTVFLPVVYTEKALNPGPALWLMFARRLLFVFAITIPFDIRDIVHDSRNKLMTIPVVLGEAKAKLVSCLLLLVFSALAVWGWYRGLMEFEYMAALLASAVIAAVILLRSTQHLKEYFYTYLVEGTLVIQCALVFIAYRLS